MSAEETALAVPEANPEWPVQVREEWGRVRKQLAVHLEAMRDATEEVRAIGLASKELAATRDAVRASVAGLFEPGNEGKLNQLREMHADLVECLRALHNNTGAYIKQELASYHAAQRVRDIDEEAIHRTVTKIESLIAEHRMLLTGDVASARKEWQARTEDYIKARLVDALGDMNVLHRIAEYIGRHISKLPELKSALMRSMQDAVSNEVRDMIREEVQKRLPRETEGS